MGHRRFYRILVSLLLAGSAGLHANPTGGAVAAGSATIAGQGSSAVTINQATNTAVINWQTFSIGAGELTKFIQPTSSSATLNRVLGGETSIIDGTLSANGQVYLLNGNGIVVGPGGIINTAGFTGSSRDISDSDFLSGKLHFTGSNDAGVTNLGNITALGGDVVLIGKTVDNKGTINATGTAGLIAGDDVMLAQKNTDGSTITVNPVSSPSAASTKIGVNNSGTITASTAELKAANGNIYALAIQNSGIVRATTVTQQGGHIYLTSDSGTIVNSGTLDASATAAKGTGGTVLVKSRNGKVIHSGKILARGGQGGAGGNAEISGAQLEFTGVVDLTAPGGSTGNLLLDPGTLTVVDGTGGSTTVISAGNDQNGSSTTIGAGLVDTTLNMANLTLNANTNVTVNSAILWTSGNTLTLSTNTVNTSGSPAIAINASITGTSGGLVIVTAGLADPITASAAIDVSSFKLQSGAWAQNVAPNAMTGASQLPGFTASNDFEINGGTFLRVSGGNGGSVPYQIVDVYGLQGVNGFLTSNFNIGSSPNIYGIIDASGTSTWNGNAGFVPLGSSSTPYTGTFTGGEIDSLTINLPDTEGPVGLFAYTASNGVVQNLTLGSPNITGTDEVGAIVGDNLGAVNNTNVNGGTITGSDDVGGTVGLNGFSGSVNGGNSGTTVVGVNEVGGVAGENEAIITTVSNYSTVSGQQLVGGLVGLNDSTGSVDDSNFGTYGNGSVTGQDVGESISYEVGGLVGENDGTVANSFTYAGPTISGDQEVGGLVGENDGTITGDTTGNNYGGFNTYNSAIVNGTSDVGGVAGYNTGTIADSYNTGAVTGTTNVGGIAGENQSAGGFENSDDFVSNFDGEGSSPGIIQTSYNAGTIQGNSQVGGIVGENDSFGTVNTTYNVGAVEGNQNSNDVGGLVGDNSGLVENSYNSGAVSGTTNVAALIGFDEDGATATNLYWDSSTTGSSQIATNNTNDNNSASESNIASVNSSTAYTISGNGTVVDEQLQSTGYGYFGAATLVSGTNGIYSIGSSPDANGGPAWYIIEGQTRPLLAMEYNYNVQNAHQLQLIALNPSYDFNIEETINASGTSNVSDIWTAAGFVPIGSGGEGGVPFSGSVYGEYNSINDLYINRPSTSNVGVFGDTNSSSTLYYIILMDSSITGLSDVGGLIGNNGGAVTYSQNNISGDNNQPVFNVRGTGNNVGGLVGVNESTGVVGEDINYAMVEGVSGTSGVGGLVGYNVGSGSSRGIVTQSINYGVVGSGVETGVGGLVGNNSGQVDDSYSTNAATVNGLTDVGGLVGHNQTNGIFETSYSTAFVSGSDTGSDPTTTGALVGVNDGIARHAYWDTDDSSLPGIGTDSTDGEGVTDVVGYSTSQLTMIQNFAQGPDPTLWNFSPEQTNGEIVGIWGINVYGAYIGSPINGGLPVLQWETPVASEISVTSGDLNYGSPVPIVITGNGASNLATNLPGGPTVTVSDPYDLNAGTTHTVTLSGTPINYGQNIEYVNGTVNIVPAPLTITADSFTLPVGQPVPTFTATYSGFAPGEDPSYLGDTVAFTVSPLPASAAGVHTITPSADFTDTNYTYNFVSGTLNFTSTSPGENQQVATVESELTSGIDRFAYDPFNGLDPLYYLVLPTHVGLEGDFLGAINNEPGADDFAFISSTSNLPALSRLATPGSGVVAIIDGYVVVGNPQTGEAVYLGRPGSQGLPSKAMGGLRTMLSPSVYQELVALIYGSH